MKTYKDHINMFLSKLRYSELVQRLFEKMTFFFEDPLATAATAATADAEKVTAALAAAGPMTMETMKTTMAVMAEAKATSSRQ